MSMKVKKFQESFSKDSNENEDFIDNKSTSDEDEQDINNQLREHFLNQKKKILFIINPASGSGRAINVFEKKVVPILKQSQIKFEVVVTAKQGSAFKYIRNIDAEEFFKWSGIVVVSGDGLLFEVFNSLMSRYDWKKAIKLPVGIIPGGSGNGLSYSISHAVGDTKQNQILAATRNVISGKHSPLDLIRVTCDKKVYYAFLSIGWGLLSDIDIESESLRILGGHRFSVWAVIRALGLRKYRGTLKFKLLPGYSKAIKGVNNKELTFRQNSISSEIQFNENDQVKLINYIINKEESFLSNKRKDNSLKRDLIDEIERILNENEDSNSKTRLHLNGKLNSRSESPNDSLSSCLSSNTTRSNSTNEEDDDLLSDKNNHNNNRTMSSIVNGGIKNGLIDPDYECETINRTKSNNNDWITIKGEFVMVYAVSTSHISSDCHFAPEARLDDGIIWLLFLKGDIGRKEVLKFLLNLEKGNHVNLPFVHLIPVSEFVLESNSPGSKITVDGELINTNTVHAEIIPSIARIMTK